MTDAFSIVVACIVSVVVMGMCLLILAYFGHPDDRMQAWIPKIVVLLSFWLVLSSVLILVLDIYNARSGGGLRIDILWQVNYIIVAVFVCVVVPFAYFYYEADQEADEKTTLMQSQFCQAFIGTFVFLIVFVVILVILFSLLHQAEIPVRRIAQNMNLVFTFDRAFDKGSIPNRGCNGNCLSETIYWEIDITFAIYIVAFLSFVGWFFFTMFVSVGLVALPIDLINEFRTRPEPITAAQYFEQKKGLGIRAEKLMEAGKAIQKDMDQEPRSRSERRQDRRNLIKFEQAFYFLKQDVEIMKIAWELKGGNPIWYYFKFFCGCIGAVISFTWFLHMLIFMIPPFPPTTFLNAFFVETENVDGGSFPLFGIIFFLIYSFYLIWAVIKGCFKVGLRFIIFKVYPLELGKTLMNAFLANVWVLLLCSVPTVQFLTFAFPIYTRLSQADLLLGTQIRYLKFFRYFWAYNTFIYCIIIIMFLTTLYLAAYPKDKAKEVELKLDKAVITYREDNEL